MRALKRAHSTELIKEDVSNFSEIVMELAASVALFESKERRSRRGRSHLTDGRSRAVIEIHPDHVRSALYHLESIMGINPDALLSPPRHQGSFR